MKPKVFLDELKAAGVVVKHGKKHYKLYYKNRQSTCPRHPAQEISAKFARIIKNHLGLEK